MCDEVTVQTTIRLAANTFVLGGRGGEKSTAVVENRQSFGATIRSDQF